MKLNLRPHRFLYILLPFLTVSVKAQPTLIDTLKIYYAVNQSEPDLAQVMVLDSFITSHWQNAIRYEILGYADYLATADYNLFLSQKRADGIKSHLQIKGVSPDKIKESKGLGQLPPFLNKADKKGIQVNRRVDLVAWYIIKGKIQAAYNTQPDLTKMKAGEKVVLHNLNFQPGSHILLPQSKPVLDSLLETLRQHPDIKIEIQGHICCMPGPQDGYDFYTQQPNLSVQRAKNVYDYLKQNGIDSTRLSYKGFGHSKPLMEDESTEEAREKNRRVEIMIVK